MSHYRHSVVTASQAVSATETLWQLTAPSDGTACVVEWGISFDGVTASAAPIDVELLRQTTAGTASAATEIEWDTAGPTARTVATTVFTVEPTPGDILASWQVTPNGGVIVMQYPLGREPLIQINERLAMRVVSPGAAVNVTAYVVFEE